MTDVVLVLTTVPGEQDGARIARTLVDERLAACVNVLPAMVSIYRWKGDVQHDTEHQLVIKTTQARLPALHARLRALHPYDLPECLILHVTGGDPGYLAWVQAETVDTPG